jgi:TolB protein
MRTTRREWLTVMAAGAVGSVMGAEDDVIPIVREAEGVAAVPVSLAGFGSEVMNALRFDLRVQGFRVVPAADAQYELSGNEGGSLSGQVRDRVSGKALLAREYRGGSARAQAHAFADDFVQLAPLGRIGIARSRIVWRIESGQASEVYLADYDGHNHVQVTRDGTITRDPSWVPGQRRLLYTSYRTGMPRIYSHDLASGERSVVAGYPGLNGSPAVSPDGRRVAMILSRTGSPDLYVANLDGTGLRQLTTTKEDESSPCWAPDGRTICVVSRQGGRPALYRVSTEGGPMRRINAVGGGSVTEPDWSPDGKLIAFTTSFGGFQICTVSANGGPVTVLGQGEDPVWARNSRTLLYVRRVGNRKVLSMLDVPTKQIEDLRRFSGSCSQPDWVR